MIKCAQHTCKLETFFACCPIRRKFRCRVCGRTFESGPHRADGELLKESAEKPLKVSLN